MYYATKHHNIRGKSGAIIGSLLPWVEIFCLANGAAKITTIDYQNVHSTHPDISFLNALDMVKGREM
jgi:hypothetical protein